MRLLIAGGGTGGHLYPGIALAEEIMRRPGGEVLFVGTSRGLETKLVPAAGFPLTLLQVSGLNRVGLAGAVRGLAKLPRAFFASCGILRRFRPDFVVGVGGYASGPLVLAAALLGYPTAIQEQNSYPGITNRVLGRLVRRVFVAFDEAGRHFAAAKTALVGNPVRRKFLEPAEAAKAATMATTIGGASDPLVLIVGGSQGARAVNERVAEALALLRSRGVTPRLLHQAGAADEARTRARYQALGLGDALASGRLEVRAFIDDMPAVLGRADLVIARAGALTLAELAIVGRPAILVPLPTAAGDHQTSNARAFVEAGAALSLRQSEATPEALADVLGTLLADPARRARMAAAMAALARPHAAAAIVDALESLSAAAPRARAA